MMRTSFAPERLSHSARERLPAACRPELAADLRLHGMLCRGAWFAGQGA
jgi:hypothetical protein